MYCRDRAQDPDFGPDELLFRRYLREHWIEGCFTSAGFHFERDSGQSVNREKYSEPEDLLFVNDEDDQYDDSWGVLEFLVSDIPPRLPDDGSVPAFMFFPRHVPKERNFAHSEIWCDREERTGRYIRPSPTVRKLLRTKLSQRVSIRIEARR